MDEKTLAGLWPAILAHEHRVDIEKDLLAAEAERVRILQTMDQKISAIRVQRDRQARIVEPLRGYALSELAMRFWSKVRILDDEDSCWVYTGYTRDRRNENYGDFNVDGRPQLAHRVAYGLIHPDEDMPAAVLHSCDNPPCCRPRHLVGGTQADNIADAARKGRMRGKTYQRGAFNDSAVLTDQIVLEARRRYGLGESAGQLAEVFGVALGTIQGAISGTTWTHLNEIEPPTTGRRSGSSLSEDDVRYIRAEYVKRLGSAPQRGDHGRLCTELASEYGSMTMANINAIVRRKSWKHVE